MSELAPLALFVFRRPAHTKRVLEALRRCPELPATPLYIFADGARHAGDEESVAATRELVAAFAHPQKKLVLAPANQGLAASIMGGVTALCREHGRAIVLEDDLIVSPAFLGYMNAALDRYAAEERVASINAFSFGDLTALTGTSAFFLNFTHPWGWATWSRAWTGFDPGAPYLEHVTADRRLAHRFNLDGADDNVLILRRQSRGEIDSWWVRWYAHLFLQDQLGLFPPVPLTRSIGADRTATNSQLSERLLQPGARQLAEAVPTLPTSIKQNPTVRQAFRAAMRPRLRRTLRLLGSAKRQLANPWGSGTKLWPNTNNRSYNQSKHSSGKLFRKSALLILALTSFS